MYRGVFFACLLAVLVAFAGAASSVLAAPGGAAPVVIQPDAVKWQPVNGMAGLQMAVLYGDPTKAGGEYAVRYNVPAGFKFPPHSHPQIEQVTVISGAFMVGVGDTMDPSKMLTLPAGAFVEIPAGLHHYGMAKTATILELHGTGPYVMDMIKQ